MAKRVIHRENRALESKPSSDTVVRTSTDNFIRNSNYQKVQVSVEDQLYLNGIIYVGIAYLKPDGLYVTLDNRYTTPRFIDLIQRNVVETNIVESRKTLSRKTKASLVQTSTRNVLKDRRIEDIIRGRNIVNTSATKIIKRSFNKRG